MAEETNNEATAALEGANKAHFAASVTPQLEDEIKKKQAAQAKKQAENEAATEEDARRQREANEKVVQPEGPSHVDLLRASMKIDNRLAGIATGEVEISEDERRGPNFHQPQPENAPKPTVKWEAGK